MSELKCGDKVLVTEGKYKYCIGIITKISCTSCCYKVKKFQLEFIYKTQPDIRKRKTFNVNQVILTNEAQTELTVNHE